MVADLLEQANIYARVDGDFLQGGVGELQAFGIIKVLVNDDDFQQARQLIKEWEANQPSNDFKEKPEWTYLHVLGGFLLGVLVGYLLALI